MRALFRVYEIEHSGDVEASLADLKGAGCSGIEVVDVCYEGEWMLVAAALPAGVSEPSELKLKVACL